jgi:hypothetical protein
MKVRRIVAEIEACDYADALVKILVLQSSTLNRSLSGKTEETDSISEMYLPDGTKVVQVDHGVYKTWDGATLRCDQLRLI